MCIEFSNFKKKKNSMYILKLVLKILLWSGLVFFFFLLPNRKRARKDVVTFFHSVVEQSSAPLLFVKFPEKSHLYLV